MTDEDEYREPEIDYGYDRVVVVDNIPVAEKEKHAKLLAVLRKTFGVVGTIKEDGITFPVDPATGMNKGFMFVEFETAEIAAEAVRRLNGHAIDKKSVFRVTLLTDMDRVMAVDDNYVEPELPEYEEVQDAQVWLHDERAREMFLTRFGDETEVYWHDSQQKPTRLFQRRMWSEFGHVFSPLGSYLATFHRAGIALWIGPQQLNGVTTEKDWPRVKRYAHNLVKYIDFSPSEQYLVTMSDQEVGPTGRPIAGAKEQSVIIWHILSGKNTREFKIEGGLKDKQHGWPMFKWSHNDKYFARIQDDSIYIRETPSMRLLDGQAIKLPGVKDFCWSPTQNIVAAFIPERGETPAKVCIIEVPSRRELRQKNLFSVADVKMHWQSNGDYLCVKVDRHSKSKKTVVTSFELFRVRERDIPIEVLEVKEDIISFAWEPKGHRFIVCHGEPPRVDVSFYTMKPQIHAPPPAAGAAGGAGGKPKKADKKAAAADKMTAVAIPERVTLLRTLEKVPVNHIFWSPAGSYVVLAGLKSLNGKLMFYNVNDFELMAEDEHFMCTDIEWDPSGRYVATYVSAWRQAMENGYQVWSFSGKVLIKVSVEKFLQFLWRPRPHSLLSEKQEAAIKKNMQQYVKKYAEEDAQLKRAHADEQSAGRRKIRQQFEEAERARKQLLEKRRAKYAHLLPQFHDVDETMEQTFEEILDVKEEVVQG